MTFACSVLFCHLCPAPASCRHECHTKGWPQREEAE